MKSLKATLRVVLANRRAAIGLGILAVLVLFAIFGPMVIGDLPADYPNRLQGPSWQHPLGTDFTGRDTLSQFILGTRDVILIAAFAGFFTILLGALIGNLSGFMGGWTDRILMLITNVVMTVPSFPVLMVLSLVINAGNPVMFGLLLSLWAWAGLARGIRSQVMTLKSSEFVKASDILGMSKRFVIVNDIVPSLVPFVAVNFVLIMRSSVLAAVGLMMLGLAPFRGEHWGIMLNLAMTKTGAMFGSSAWVYLLTPIVGIVVFQMACFMFANGLEDAFDPRVRSEINA
ncbi:MAG: ABC transporter permease [Candidatus Nanopelagicales bacterium]